MHEPYGLASHEAGAHNDLIIYGHTHDSEWRAQAGTADKLVINPGEVCGWVTGRATFALFALERWEGELALID